MSEWIKICPPPLDKTLGDHDVPQKGDYLKGKRIALLCTGSIASITVPTLSRELRKYGADVQVFATPDAIKCGVGITALEWGSYPNPVITELTSHSEHLSLGKLFDLYLVAPATANTINKVACGISDTVVTNTLASALGRSVPIVMVPAMHGSLHTPILTQSIEKLRNLGVFFVAPFNAYGKHNMQEKDVVVSDVCRILSKSNIKNIPILVTAGPTPVKIDNVRRLTNKFSGKLGILIAKHLYFLGADVHLLQSYSGIRPERYLPYTLFKDYDEYYEMTHSVIEMIQNKAWKKKVPYYGIFSAAVADYKPTEVFEGKIPSKGALKTITFVDTKKVIDDILEKFPDINLISFKYEEGKTKKELRTIAKQRLDKGHCLVVVNDGTMSLKEQQAELVSKETFDYDPSLGLGESYHYIVGKQKIANEIGKFLCKRVIKKMTIK